MVEDKVSLDGTEYVVAHRFGSRRVAIIYNGAPCMLDKVDREWKVSHEPATPKESAAMNLFRMQG